MSLPHDLQRFVRAQDAHDTWRTALGELRAGRKRTHWMWFVFPQIAGLGRSDMARRYAIADKSEARAYLAHPVLGPRLLQACQTLLDLGSTEPVPILGSIDAMKLRSSMTLFEHVDDDHDSVFTRVLDQYYARERDSATGALIGAQ